MSIDSVTRDTEAPDTGAPEATRPVPSRRHRRRVAPALTTDPPLWVLAIGGTGTFVFSVDGRNDPPVVRLAGERLADSQETPSDWASIALQVLEDALPRTTGRSRVVVLLDAPMVSTQGISVPKTSARKRRQMLTMSAQVAGFDSFAVRSRPPRAQESSADTTLEVSYAHGKQLDTLHTGIHHRFGRSPTILSRSVGALALLRASGGEDLVAGRLLLMELEARVLRIHLIDAGTVIHSRSMDLGRADSDEQVVNRCLTEVQRSNTYLATRLGEAVARKAVLLSTGATIPRLVADRLEDRFEMEAAVIVPRVKVVGAEEVWAQAWATDAAAVGLVRRSDDLLSLQFQPPILRQRRRIAAGLLAQSLFGTLAVVSVLQLESRVREEHQTSERTWQASLDARQTSSDLADRAPELAAQRAALARWDAELGQALGPALPIENILIDLMGRLPASVVVDGIQYKAATGAESPPSVELSARCVASLVKAPKVHATVMDALRQSPWCRQIEDRSGEYDPFASQPANTTELFPLRFTIILGEGS